MEQIVVHDNSVVYNIAMIILLHSSKTMHTRPRPAGALRPPRFLGQARQLDAFLKTLSADRLAAAMSLSPALAAKTHALIAAWTDAPEAQTAVLDSFAGDIYSGLQAAAFTPAEYDYADASLYILSGLYGVLRPGDGICPYRLEMGYRLPGAPFANLYDFWGDAIAAALRASGPVVNLAADEYSRAVLPHLPQAQRVISPRFYTRSPKSGQAEFVVVHAKIGRGAMANWLIRTQTEDPAGLPGFDELGYAFDPALSQPGSPAFVAEVFGGKGLSVRQKRAK